ncbi:MAG: hypothetical protein Q4B68_08090 [Bacteroidales bacterium]|nr:hypothetical protein [Bacteroidales bacterium]
MGGISAPTTESALPAEGDINAPTAVGDISASTTESALPAVGDINAPTPESAPMVVGGGFIFLNNYLYIVVYYEIYYYLCNRLRVRGCFCCAAVVTVAFDSDG